MRVAFDLDDTLIPKMVSFPTERPPPGWLAGWLCQEPLRQGTTSLLVELRSLGHEIWIYTSSHRHPWAVKLLFGQYGVRIRGVVNQDRHDAELRKWGARYRSVSKFPPAFGIDLLVDDNPSVWADSASFGFRAILVRPEDVRWVETVKRALGSYSAARAVAS